jgi:hypothetical protein
MPSHRRDASSFVHLLLISLIYLFAQDEKSSSVRAVIPTFSTPAGLLYGGAPNITADMPDEQRLFYTLMTGYERAVRPTKKSSEAVVVKLGITLTQIMDIVSDETKRTMNFDIDI